MCSLVTLLILSTPLAPMIIVSKLVIPAVCGC
jgi:hypothetical protein